MDIELSKQIDKANEVLGEELGKWEALGIDPNQFVKFNMILMDAYVTSLAEVLVEKGVIEDGELTLALKNRMILNLGKHREVAEEMRKKANLEAIRGGRPLMAVPNKKSLN